MGRLLVWLLSVLPIAGLAQFQYRLDDSIPVTRNSQSLTMPWAGGLNASQYNSIDLNFDGTDDLVVFDRMANAAKTFINDNNQYRYAPEYEAYFPSLTNWLILRDFNGDGKKDIFTGDPLGIRVFTSASNSTTLSWTQYFFYVGPGLPKSPVLLTQGFTSKINLQLQFDDLPSFVDVDGDGDLDILAFRYVGEATIEFHRNNSQEDYSHSDSLEFERITQNWGNFIECQCGVIAFNGDPCPTNGGGRIQHAGGKSLLAIDIDNDNDLDLLFSEAECNHLFLLENEGDNTTPFFTSDVPFPQDNPIDMWTFPAPFYEDVDFDGTKDLMVSPNIFARDYLEVDLQRSNWLFTNSGSTSVPDLAFTRNDFLQNQMIDVGDNSAPALFDLDGDGDVDLVAGRYVDPAFGVGTLVHYENDGNASEPHFNRVTEDYLSFSESDFINIKPQFADFNFDGKTDLVFTATSLSTSLTKIYVLYNKVSPGVDFQGQSPAELPVSILFSENIHAKDINRDGLMDLLIGKSAGTIEYWQNNGSKAVPSFVLEDSDYLNLGPSIERQNPSLTTADLDADGREDLLIGDFYGALSVIDDFRNTGSEPPPAIKNIVYDPVNDTYYARKLGGRALPAVANLFNAAKPALIVGNLLGGLHVLRPENEGQSSEDPTVRVFPVPVPRGDDFYVESSQAATVQLISSLGQALGDAVSIQPYSIYSFDTSRMSRGIYIVRIQAGAKSFARRIVVY